MRYEWRKCRMGKQIDMRIRGLLAAASLAPTPALAQALNYTTFGNPGSLVTTVTGIRGNGMTGDFTTGTGGSTAGVLYTLPSLTPAPYPNSSAPPVNLTGATTNTPYGPSFGSASGIMRGIGSYKPAAFGADVRRPRLPFDGANAPGQQLTPLIGGAAPSTRSATRTSATSSSATGTSATPQ